MADRVSGKGRRDDCHPPLYVYLSCQSLRGKAEPLTVQIRTIVKFLVSALCLAAIPIFVPVEEILKHIRDIEPLHLLVAFVLIALNTLLSSLRFYEMMKSFGIFATLQSAHKINIFSQIVGVFALQTVGQMVFRTAYGGRFVENPQRLALLTIIEKGIALLTLSLIGLVGSYYITRHIEFGGTGDAQLVILTTAIILSLAASYTLGMTASQRRFGRRVWRLLTRSGLEKAAVLSLAMHGLMLVAYIVVASGFLGDAPLTMIAALFSVVMLGAALPISFAGWGIRELSAGFVFALLGYDPSIGIVLGAAIGVVSLLALGMHAVVSNFMTKSLEADVAEYAAGGAAETHFERMIALFCGLGIAVLIGIQVRVPTGSGAMTVNLADPIAIVGAISFLAFWYREYLHQAVWRLNGLAPAMFLLLALIAYGWLLGYARNGFSSWATYNRGVGYFILLAYLFAGSMVTAFFGRGAVRSLIRVFLVTNLCILLVYFVGFGLIDRPTRGGVEWRRDSYAGLIGNRNALAFAMSIALAAMLAIKTPILGRWRPTAIALAAFVIVISGSRTGMTVAAVAMSLAFFLRSFSPKEFSQVAVATVGLVSLHYVVNAYLPEVMIALGTALAELESVLAGADSEPVGFVLETFGAIAEALQTFRSGTDVAKNVEIGALTIVQSERFEGYWVALDMWLSQPVFGTGMGAFISHYVDTRGIPLVIDNSGLWILTEMGLVGLVLFLPLPWAVVAHLRRKRGQTLKWDDHALLLCLFAAAVFSLAHDMLYQRILWFMLGLLAANKFRLADTLSKRAKAAFAPS